MAPPAAPFYGFRFSSSTSIDVLVDKQKNTWNGLVSVSDVSIEELLRQAKVAFPDKFKAIFLSELPRMLTWGGSKCPKTDENEGTSFFTDGQVLTCELEDPSSGEIDDKKITCTVDKLEATSQQAEELINKLAEEDDVQQVPQVGLDAMLGGGGAGASRHADPSHDEDEDYEDFDDEEEEEEDDDEEEEAEQDQDLIHGLGADAGPPQQVKDSAIKTQLKSIIQLAQMMGVPNPEIREAWTNCGGILVENPQPHHGEDEDPMMMHGHGDEDDQHAGGPPQPGCKQQ